jgi:osmoprotectant transport system ATP-binding protein
MGLPKKRPVPLIEILNLSKAYAGSGTQAVSGLSLSVPAGEFLVLIGPSGSGKTTTLNMVNRLVEPDGGEIRIEGHNVLDSDPVMLRRGIGYVFQEAGLFPHMTVAENIAVTPRLLNWDKARIDARVHELLAMVRLEEGEFGGRFPQELSGGQRQRVALARALAVRPHILLLDEPFGALDPVTREAVAADVREIHQKLGLTTLMVTHDMTEALLMADRIAVMRDGHLVQVGTPRELVAHPTDNFVAQLIETPRRRARALAETLNA